MQSVLIPPIAKNTMMLKLTWVVLATDAFMCVIQPARHGDLPLPNDHPWCLKHMMPQTHQGFRISKISETVDFTVQLQGCVGEGEGSHSVNPSWWHLTKLQKNPCSHSAGQYSVWHIESGCHNCHLTHRFSPNIEPHRQSFLNQYNSFSRCFTNIQRLPMVTQNTSRLQNF